MIAKITNRIQIIKKLQTNHIIKRKESKKKMLLKYLKIQFFKIIVIMELLGIT